MTLSADFWDEVKKLAINQTVAILESSLDSMLTDGRVIGDVKLQREQRVARYMQLRDEGVLEHLRVISPKLLEEMQKQFLKDIEASPMLGHERGAA